MLAALAFEPLVCAGFRVERPEQSSAAVREPDPEMAALIREIRRVEGETASIRHRCSGSSRSAALPSSGRAQRGSRPVSSCRRPAAFAPCPSQFPAMFPPGRISRATSGRTRRHWGGRAKGGDRLPFDKL